jgi:hypothetical protein
MPRLLITVVLALVGCELERLPTAAGDHVIYHWDADEYQLCGGTIPLIDRHIEIMTGYYGWSASERSVEYFWDAELARKACSRGDAFGCAHRFSTSTMVFTNDSLDTHELGHTTRVGAPHAQGSAVDFIDEGFATRWSSSILELSDVPISWATFLSEAELRAALEADDTKDFSYGYAFTWWLALELEYGPAKMAEFVAELEGAASADDVEAALQRVFGISLAESAALAEDLPVGAVDDPACALEGLPTYTWAGSSLVVERDDPTCADEDIVNVFNQDAMWLFVLEFPDTPTSVEVSVTVPEGEDPLRKSLNLIQCSGEYHFGEFPPTYNAIAGYPDFPTGPWKMWGRHVGALSAPLEADGSIALPRVALEQAIP